MRIVEETVYNITLTLKEADTLFEAINCAISNKTLSKDDKILATDLYNEFIEER